MERVHKVRLLPSLAVPFLLAATLTLPAVSHGSVVDQYTEIIPTPGGGKPSQPPSPSAGSSDLDTGSAALAPGASAVVVIEDVVTEPNRGRSGKEATARRDAREPEIEVPGGAGLETPSAPSGMGPLFPALLLTGLVASAGFLAGRRQGARGTDR